MDGKNPAVLNNLAWFIAHDDPPQLDRALELTNKVISLFPTQKEFHESRGQIHALRNQWEEARQDLELATTVMPDHIELHRTLVKVYEALALPTMARVHREKVDLLEQANRAE